MKTNLLASSFKSRADFVTFCQCTRATITTKRLSAVTLTELLVAISIMVILIALAIPVANNSRKAFQATTCVNNMRQVGSAIILFAADHKGNILPRQLSEDLQKKEPNAPSYWIRRLVADGYLTGPVNDAPLNPSLYCPSHLPDGQPTTWTSIYGMRMWRGTAAKPDEYLKTTQIKVPSRLFLIADSMSATSGAQWYNIPFNSTSHGIHLRHFGKANAFFADGHVAATEAEYFKSLPANDPEFTYRSFMIFGPDGKPVE